MQMLSLNRSTLLLLSVFFASHVLFGCAADKKMVSPYEAKAERERALKQEEAKQLPEFELTPRDGSQPEPLQGGVVNNDALMPTLTLINDRIYAYEEKLRSWKAFQERTGATPLRQETLNTISDCRVQLQDLLVEYNALHQRLLQKTSLESAELLAGDSLLALSKKDMAYLESDCTRLIEGRETATSVGTGMPGSLHQEEMQIQDAYDQGDYAQVVALYEQLPVDTLQDVSYDATYSYGQALMKTHRQPEAKQVLVDLLSLIRQQDQAQWEFKLMQVIGDLEFGLNAYDAATIQYQEIAERYQALSDKSEWAAQQLSALAISDQQSKEVRQYADLLKAYLGYNPDRDGYAVVQQAESYTKLFPYSPVSSNADLLLAKAKKDAEVWLNAVLGRIDELEAQGQYQEALLLLERVPKNILPPEKQDLLRRKTDELTTSESIAIETTRLVQEQTLQDDWNVAMTYLEAKDYDQAIEGFTRLLDSVYQDKARLRIDEAANLAAQEDRQRAAELFMRAKRTHDLESQKKLLFASRKLLQDILVKYPQSNLIEKVKRNLARIEEEIVALDPALLTAPATIGGDIILPDNSAPAGTQPPSDSLNFN